MKYDRGSESRYLCNMARKARRRGDAQDAARWFKVMDARQMAADRFEAAVRRDIKFEREEAARMAEQERAEQERAEQLAAAPKRKVEHGYFQRRLDEMAKIFFDRHEAGLPPEWPPPED